MQGLTPSGITILYDANNKVLENSQSYMRESAENMLEDSSVGLMDAITSPLQSARKVAKRRPDISGLSELGNRAFAPGGTQRTLDFINENGMSRKQLRKVLGAGDAVEEVLRRYGTGAAPSLYENYR